MRSAGDPLTAHCSGGLTQQPRAIFASELRHQENPTCAGGVVQGSDLATAANLRGGDLSSSSPIAGRVVDYDNHSSEYSLAPNRVVRSRSGMTLT